MFSEAEKKILAFLTLKYKDVIESVGTDAVTVKKKNHQWKIIEREFRTMGGKKTIQQLKNFWGYMRRKPKEKKNIHGGEMQFQVTRTGPLRIVSHTRILTNNLDTLSWPRPHPMNTSEDIVDQTPINPSEIKVEPLSNTDPQSTSSNTPKHSSATCHTSFQHVDAKRHRPTCRRMFRQKSSQPSAAEMEAKARVERVQQLMKMDKELHETHLQQENEIHKQKMLNLKNRMMRDNEIYRCKLLHLNLEMRKKNHS